MSWADIPTCKEAGLDVTLMLRGIFMPPGVKPEHVAYTGLFKKVMATPRWKKLMEEGVQHDRALGPAVRRLGAKEEQRASRAHEGGRLHRGAVASAQTNRRFAEERGACGGRALLHFRRRLSSPTACAWDSAGRTCTGRGRGTSRSTSDCSSVSRRSSILCTPCASRPRRTRPSSRSGSSRWCSRC